MKLFCVGLAKSGSCSLAAALRILGFNALHDYRTCERITADVLSGRYPVDVDRADAFCDWPHPIGCFPKLGELFPDCRFILTDRDPESWVRSRLIHVLHSRVTGESVWREADTLAWVKERAELLAAAGTWGDAHPGRMLVFNVRDGWEPLCAFLGVGVPAEPFPRENGSRRRLLDLLKAYPPPGEVIAYFGDPVEMGHARASLPFNPKKLVMLVRGDHDVA